MNSNIILNYSISITDIDSAKLRINTYINETPLIRAAWLEEKLACSQSIYLKLENKQVTGSFKARGAFNAMLLLTDAQKERGVITRSSGNFAQAVSYAANKLSVKATIVMPENAPKTKVEGTKKYGATVVLFGKTHKECSEKVAELAKESGATLLHPFDYPAVIAGQGTMALEILDDLPEMATFICPVGGGGLLGGNSLAIKSKSRTCNVIAAEPELAKDFFLSFQNKAHQEVAPPVSIADGLLAAKVGNHNWPILRDTVDSVHLVSEEEILSAMKLLVSNMPGAVIEPSGSVSVAALINLLNSSQDQLKGPIVCVISGGNVDKDKFPTIY
jgi:threonine dehydratase